uniref:Uracil phosphoribosyltransferase n=1 Tax=Plocamium cartilagineum TaxID=31452 RepID=A0A1C9CHW5_PLOCA|nr:uracil phosphoribosyltransferase [Plocamium cartilagineum]AOM67971.1 uracil phosphoribosyltransferase [Plocamium cartilagineum]
MPLNIYLMSHPIIKQLSYQITKKENNKQIVNHHHYKNIGILLIYETIRQWIELQNIYIKQIHSIKEICLFNEQESYIIITDLSESYHMISEIILLLPNVSLHHISLIEKEQVIYNNLNNLITDDKKIIFIQKSLNNYFLIQILDYLLSKKHVKISQIKIICIICDNKIIEKIGYKYPNLNIYTTKIQKK